MTTISDYILRGTKKLVSYWKSLNVDVTKEKLSSAANIPVILLEDGGVDGAQYVSPRFTGAQGQSLATLLGVGTGDLLTNAGMERMI